MRFIPSLRSVILPHLPETLAEIFHNPYNFYRMKKEKYLNVILKITAIFLWYNVIHHRAPFGHITLMSNI